MLDVESLLVVNAANQLVMAATLPVIMGRQLSKAAASARNGILVQALGILAIVLSGLWPGQWADHVISALAVSLLALGQWLLFCALQAWLGPRRFGPLLRSLIVLAPAGYLLLAQNFALRTAWANLMMIMQLLLIAQATLYPKTGLGGRWRWVMFGCCVTMAAFTAARTVLVLFYPADYPNFMAPHPVNVANMVAGNVTLVLATVATLVAWREEAEAALRDQALSDNLTGLSNRRGWDEQAPLLFDQAQRHRSALALLMLDLDHFKRVNDTHGHEAGDQVLKLFADLLRANRRSSDLTARIGGEEFAVLLPQTDAPAAALFEQRLRLALAKAAGKGDMAPLAIDYSAGLTLLDHASDRSIHALMARADAALYRAKDLGRGRLHTIL